MHSLCNITFALELFKKFATGLWSLHNLNSLTGKYILLCS